MVLSSRGGYRRVSRSFGERDREPEGFSILNVLEKKRTYVIVIELLILNHHHNNLFDDYLLNEVMLFLIPFLFLLWVEFPIEMNLQIIKQKKYFYRTRFSSIDFYHNVHHDKTMPFQDQLH